MKDSIWPNWVLDTVSSETLARHAEAISLVANILKGCVLCVQGPTFFDEISQVLTTNCVPVTPGPATRKHVVCKTLDLFKGV